MIPSRVSFRVAKPVVARSKDTSTTATIPSGSVVEVLHPAVGDAVEVQWGGQVYSVSLSNLLRACGNDDARKTGLE
jgi:hypothetical protein